MGTLELEDRLRALEALTTELMRTLLRAKLLGAEEAERLLDRVEERMTGEAGAVFAAQLLADGIGADRGPLLEEPEAPIRSAFRHLLYGPASRA
ncbi:hypothetical protein M446_5986 [Methylobacterium sp. 4-46]|uniref:hypothetical protein n=1 Tax=unclassified Methylobacterium TaxID=2615210 RepID=UPI000152EA87|nr:MULTISPECIES: hypothetical protein [Methylobacterium]ACA20263.1 hypothetical protein M446_5986 [Methylobacterium sp. 4-46]WFT79440.1 hypothetical protein QA634_30210 [Methylobacterium nodulans]